MEERGWETVVRVREDDEVVGSGDPQCASVAVDRLDRVAEPERGEVRRELRHRRVEYADDADAVVAGVEEEPVHRVVGREPAVGRGRATVARLDVRDDPRLWRPREQVPRPVEPVVEVVVAERARVGLDRLEEVQRLFAVGRQRQHARSGAVAGPEDECRVVGVGVGGVVTSGGISRLPSLSNQSSEPCDAVGVVEGVLDVGVVEEVGGHR